MNKVVTMSKTPFSLCGCVSSMPLTLSLRIRSSKVAFSFGVPKNLNFVTLLI